MNLAEMAAQICADTGYLDTDDVTFAKQALRQRDDLLWRMGLWKDSLVQVNLTVDPENNEDHAEGVIYLPAGVERVIGVRTADHALNVSGLETFFRAGFDAFGQTGEPWEFAKLRPGWFTWRGFQGLQLATAAGDSTQTMRVKWRDDAGTEHTDALQDGGQLTSTPTSTDKSGMLVSAAGVVTLNGLLIAADETYNGKPIYLSGTAAISGGTLSGSGGQIHWDGSMWQAGVLISGAFGDYYGSNDAVATPDLVTTWIDQGDPTLPTVTAQYRLNIEVYALYKPTTSAAVSLNPILSGDAAGGTLPAADTASPVYQRIRLLPKPTAETAIKILAKAAYVPLDFDQAEPQITGSHLALMAFAKHSLRKRGGEHGAAAEDLNEAMGLLETLKKEEMQQEAHNQRIIPAYGYGDQFFGPGRDGFFVG